MRRTINAIAGGGLVLAISFAGTASAFQQTPDCPREERSPIRDAARPSGPAGQFTSLHQDKLTIKNSDGGIRTFQTVDQTQVLLNGRPAKLTDLRNGDSIRIVTGPGETALRIVASRGEQERPQGEQARQSDRQDNQQRNPQDNQRGAGRPDFERNETGNQPRSEDLGTQSQATRQNHAWLGLMLRDAENREGLEVVRTYPSGPASRAGVTAGDLIQKIGDRSIQSQEDIDNALSGIKPGEDVELVVMRGEQKANLDVRAGDRRDYLGEPPVAPPRQDGNGAERSGEGEGQADNQDDPWIADHAMMLEQHRRFAEQHQRMEEKLDKVLTELEDLRQQLGQAPRRERRGAGRPDLDSPIRETREDNETPIIEEAPKLEGAIEEAPDLDEPDEEATEEELPKI